MECTNARPSCTGLMAIRCMTALHQLTCPWGLMAMTASCMLSSNAVNSLRLLSSAWKLFPPSLPMSSEATFPFQGVSYTYASNCK